ncbi:TIM-barrel domain-containing protein [Streptacidiphilus sp. P02-A3a]|uniref:glycoside hydrolase family 31 protein n=1 Tax=Streptacidiphilus sp. P02-A3a TaxID=2704468 RepID=UPI0015FA4541|nr:glycoside hydrolase family 31 protein [Streptacidiphilus sp. P02-A3a]QMU69820.1 glycoside hydrolase family 31 protein [Streptacidiphilus sp. P02-A3a]
MPNHIHDLGGALEWRARGETLRVEPWGRDSVRVRATPGGALLPDLPGALLDADPATAGTAGTAEISIEGNTATLVNGAITVRLDGNAADASDPQLHPAAGRLTFLNTADGSELLAEEPHHFWWPGPRLYTATGNGYHRLEQRFRAYPGERLYGLGQHTHGLLDQKGAVIDLVQRNAEVSIPFLLSDRGYGLLWNSPAIGRVELAETGTRWVADSARQLDYWVTAGRPADVLRRYADATGHSPMLPDWAAGFWQCKLRYRTQEELLEVAREYRRRDLPLDVIVADFFHWTHLGEWRFDPEEWPDPAAMVAELDRLGVKLMVSVWPSVSPLSENFHELLNQGHLINTEYGPVAHADWPDKGLDAYSAQVAFYDATNPDARAFVWERLRRNYLDLGIKVWWLDACEPELKPGYPANLRYHAGPGLEVGNLYPRENARMIHEGMTAAGESEVVSLNRSSWAGAQRYGAALWSGDIGTDFASLRAQIKAGLNVMVSGIPWWTTDIGGFHGGDPDDPGYREVLVRWFQYGAFCPLFRLHGFRGPEQRLEPAMTGLPNEVWSYGDEAYRILTSYLRLRERLRPYLLRQLAEAAEQGLPPMRPLFVEFPDDPAAWTVDDAFLLGPDLLVAPVTEAGARRREVYLPSGADWTDAWTGAVHPGGSRTAVDAPLDRIPLFLRDGAELPIQQEA